MADLGKVVVTDGGNYVPDTTYEKLTFVHYGSNTYMTLKTVTDIVPTDDGVNYKLFCRSAELATATIPGTVKPDGTTTEVSADGTLSAKVATQSTAGIVKGSNGIKVGADGSIDISTLFEQATDLANIIAGEAIASALGKISKAIAVTMGLNENALLKNMLTNIDADDQNKIPTTKLTHAHSERIGMGTELSAGANLTAAVNALNSNLKAFGVFYTSLATQLTLGTVSTTIPVDVAGINDGQGNYTAQGGVVNISQPGIYIITGSVHGVINPQDFVTIRLATSNPSVYEGTSSVISNSNSGAQQFLMQVVAVMKITVPTNVYLAGTSVAGTASVFPQTSSKSTQIRIQRIS